MVQWARAHHCPWNEVTLCLRRCGWESGVLQWARAHGCPWDETTCSAAADAGHTCAEVGAGARLPVDGMPTPTPLWAGSLRH